MFYNIYVCGMQQKSFMQFFYRFVDEKCLLACFECICHPVVGGFELLIVGKY